MDNFKVQFFIQLQDLIRNKINNREDPNHPLNKLLLNMWAEIGNTLTHEEVKAILEHNLKVNNQLN